MRPGCAFSSRPMRICIQVSCANEVVYGWFGGSVVFLKKEGRGCLDCFVLLFGVFVFLFRFRVGVCVF